jgi:cytochrome c biogenesis protein CcmG, thiol:disulfide interchange protein DsbE
VFMRFVRHRNLILIALITVAFARAPHVLAKFKIGTLPKENVAAYVIRTTDGRTHTLQDMRGQVVVLDFFTVWCAHVRDHMPTLTRFDEEDRERGLRVIGMIVNDAETTQERINQFIKDQKINFPISIINDPIFKLFVDSKDLAVPQTLVFARNGRLAAHIVGQSDETEAELQAIVKRELAKKN